MKHTPIIVLLIALAIAAPVCGAKVNGHVMNPGERLAAIKRELAKGPGKADVAHIKRLEKGLSHKQITEELRGDIYEAERVQKSRKREEREEKIEEKKDKKLEEKEEREEIDQEVVQDEEDAGSEFSAIVGRMDIWNLCEVAPFLFQHYISNLNDELKKEPFERNPTKETARGRMYRDFIKAFVEATKRYVEHHSKDGFFDTYYKKVYNTFFDNDHNLRVSSTGLLGGEKTIHVENCSINKAQNANEVKDFILKKIRELDPNFAGTTNSSFVDLIRTLREKSLPG